MLEKYFYYLKEVSKDWNEKNLATLYCVGGIVEESFELTQEPDISEQGDVLFYLFMLVILQELDFEDKDLYEDSTLIEVSIKFQSILSKHVFHGNNIDRKMVCDMVSSIMKKTLKMCKNDLADVLHGNMVKLNMRHPNGKYTAYVNKNHEAEKEAISKNVKHG